jgi:hypothetical protein
MRLNQHNVQVFLTEDEEAALMTAVRNMVSIQLGEDVPNKKKMMLIYRPMWRFINEMLRERSRNETR